MSETVSNAVVIENGEWAGWRVWQPEPFEQMAGPFYACARDGLIRCAFRVESKHLNGAGSVHGGCLMSFADFSIFAISEAHWAGNAAVTISVTCDFVGAARSGDVVEATGEVVQATKNLLFMRGMATVAGRPVANFSGIIKAHRRSPTPAANKCA